MRVNRENGKNINKHFGTVAQGAWPRVFTFNASHIIHDLSQVVARRLTAWKGCIRCRCRYPRAQWYVKPGCPHLHLSTAGRISCCAKQSARRYILLILMTYIYIIYIFCTSHSTLSISRWPTEPLLCCVCTGIPHEYRFFSPKNGWKPFFVHIPIRRTICEEIQRTIRPTSLLSDTAYIHIACALLCVKQTLTIFLFSFRRHQSKWDEILAIFVPIYC